MQTIPHNNRADTKLLQALIPSILLHRLRAEATLRGVKPHVIVERALEGHLTVQALDADQPATPKMADRIELKTERIAEAKANGAAA